MKWILILLLCLAGLLAIAILALLVLGLLQPVKHSVTRSLHLKQKPAAVFGVLEDPGWSTAVLKVEPLPARAGKPVSRVTLRWGHMQMIMTQLERTPPTRLVVSMSKDGGPTLGTWTYQLSTEDDGCRITVTEEGEMANPIYRAVGRIRGLDANILQTLRDLASKFGESAEIREN